MSNSNLESPLKKDRVQPKFVKPIFVILLLLILSPIILIYVLLVDLPLRVIFLLMALTNKKSIIFVYSESPIWKTYLENNILPMISEHAIILNWSERNQWKRNDWAVRAFHHWGGEQDFNPLAIVFCNFFKVKTIRFYRPFLDYKHGKEQPLRETVSKLFDLMKRNIPE